MDLLPKSFKRNKLINWLKKSAKDLGLKPIDVQLMSAAKGDSVLEIAGAIDELREGKDVYIVGATNVGKSTFINQLIRGFVFDK